MRNCEVPHLSESAGSFFSCRFSESESVHLMASRAARDAKAFRRVAILVLGFAPLSVLYAYQRRRHLNQLVTPDDVKENAVNDVRRLFNRLGSHRPTAVDNLRKERITLYQFATCPYCSMVRAFLDVHQIPYRVVEVDPFSKAELKALAAATSPPPRPGEDSSCPTPHYAKVPILAFEGGPVLVDSKEIVDVLSEPFANPRNMLGSGRAGIPKSLKTARDVIKKDAEDASTSPSTSSPASPTLNEPVTTITQRNPWRMTSSGVNDAVSQRCDGDIAAWREWSREALVRYITMGLNASLSDAATTVQWVSQLDMPTSTKIKCISAGAVMFLLAHTAVLKNLRKAGYPGVDIHAETAEQIALWTKEGIKGRLFHGGVQPDIADTDVYGVLRILEKHPLGVRIAEEAPPAYQEWYMRMASYGSSCRGKGSVPTVV